MKRSNINTIIIAMMLVATGFANANNWSEGKSSRATLQNAVSFNTNPNIRNAFFDRSHAKDADSARVIVSPYTRKLLSQNPYLRLAAADEFPPLTGVLDSNPFTTGITDYQDKRTRPATQSIPPVITSVPSSIPSTTRSPELSYSPMLPSYSPMAPAVGVPVAPYPQYVYPGAYVAPYPGVAGIVNPYSYGYPGYAGGYGVQALGFPRAYGLGAYPRRVYPQAAYPGVAPQAGYGAYRTPSVSPFAMRSWGLPGMNPTLPLGGYGSSFPMTGMGLPGMSPILPMGSWGFPGMSPFGGMGLPGMSPMGGGVSPFSSFKSPWGRGAAPWGGSSSFFPRF